MKPLSQPDVDVLTHSQRPFFFGRRTTHPSIAVMNFWLKVDTDPATRKSMCFQSQDATDLFVVEAFGDLTVVQLKVALLVNNSGRNFRFDPWRKILAST